MANERETEEKEIQKIDEESKTKKEEGLGEREMLWDTHREREREREREMKIKIKERRRENEWRERCR